MKKNTRTGSSTPKTSTPKKKPPAKPARAAAKNGAAKKSVAKKIATTLKKVVKTAKTAARKAVKTVSGAAKPTAKSTTKNLAKSAVKRAGKAVKSVGTTLAKTVSKASKVSAKSATKSLVKRVAKDAKKAVKKVAKKVAAGPKRVSAKATKTATATVKTAKAATKPKAGSKSKTATATTAAKTRPAVKTRRPKTFSGREAVLPFGFPEATPELPENYGEDRLVLMTKDPEYLFAYWEITPESLKAGEAVKHRGEKYREALRLNWTARDIFDANYLLMPVSLAARKWYLRVPWSGLAYQIEIGWLGSRGHFIALLTSNPSDAPESWHATRRRLAAAGVSQDGPLGRALAGGQPQGSSERTSAASASPAAQAHEGVWSFEGPDSLSSSFGTARGSQRVVAPSQAARTPSKPRKG